MTILYCASKASLILFKPQWTTKMPRQHSSNVSVDISYKYRPEIWANAHETRDSVDLK